MEWDSGLNILEKINVKIDYRVLVLAKKLKEKFPGKEFSVLLKGRFEGGDFVVDFDYYIPEQEVTQTSVEYKEDLAKLREQGYNTVLHIHPFTNGNTKFSATDEEYINNHFTLSLLINNNLDFTDATFLVKLHDELKLKIRNVDVEVVFSGDLAISDEELSKITEKTYYYPHYSQYADYSNSSVVERKKSKKKKKKKEKDDFGLGIEEFMGWFR